MACSGLRQLLFGLTILPADEKVLSDVAEVVESDKNHSANLNIF